MIYKYPIGTRIRYKGICKADVGKEGRIVGLGKGNTIHIVVPGSYVALSIYNDSSHPWTTFVTDVEVLVRKNEQLLFDFMNE